MELLKCELISQVANAGMGSEHHDPLECLQGVFDTLCKIAAALEIDLTSFVYRDLCAIKAGVEADQKES